MKEAAGIAGVADRNVSIRRLFRLICGPGGGPEWVAFVNNVANPSWQIKESGLTLQLGMHITMTAGLSYAALSAVLNPNMARCMGQQSAIAWGRRFCRHEDARCLKPSVDEICSYALSVGASLRSTGLTGTQAGNSAQKSAITNRFA